MIGPFPAGFYTSHHSSNTGDKWEHLVAGKTYVVSREFIDNDRQVHPVGERWKFLGYSYNRFDEGLSLFVTLDGEQEWHIPLENTVEEQQSLLDSLNAYIQETTL